MLLESQQVQRLYLDELAGKPTQSARVRLVQLITEDIKQAPKVAQALIKAIESGKLAVDNKAQILEIIETILVYKFPKLSREEIQKMLGYNDISLKETRFYQDVYAEGQQEGIQKGRQEGEQKGLQKGLQKGQQEGEAKLILRQLTRRFGTLGEGTQNRIKHLNIGQLEALGDALLDFSIQEDVERWLEK